MPTGSHTLTYVSRLGHTERMKTLVDQALDEARQHSPAALTAITLVVYGALPDAALFELFEQVAEGTPAQGAALRLERAGSRYICWNCCGARFESGSGVCPNCGELAMEVPDDLQFGLKSIETG